MFDSFVDNDHSTGSYLVVSASQDGRRLWTVPPFAAHSTLQLEMGPRHHQGFWAVQLDNAVRAATGPVTLVAEGLACLAIVRWAQLSPRRYVENIANVLIFSPLTFSLAQAPLFKNLHPSPATRLPFDSVVIDDRSSPLITRVLDLVDTWGSRFVEAANVPDDWRRQPGSRLMPTRGCSDRDPVDIDILGVG